MSKVSKKGVILKVSSDLNDGSKSSKSSRKLFAYVVDKEGKVIEIAPVTKGEVALKTKPEIFRGKARVFITGKMEGRGKRKPTLGMLEKVKAYQPSIRLSKDNILDVGIIPDFQLPFMYHCKIVGSVKNHFTIDGENQILPVDDVRVHICEVDPWFLIIKRLPDYEILDIREKLLDMIHERYPPIPDPIPDPWPPFKERIPRPFPSFKNRNIGEMPGKMPTLLNKSETKMMNFSLPNVSETVAIELASPNVFK